MILSINCIGFIKLKEVKDEEEAFYEMRRYMEVNNIYSDTTTLYTEEYTDCNNVSEMVKSAVMCPYSGLHEDLSFTIHYDTIPEYDSLEDALSRNSVFAYYYESYKNKENAHGYNSLRFWRYKSSNADDCFYSWFPDEYKRYIIDMKKESW